jgi:hypothetical protein
MPRPAGGNRLKPIRKFQKSAWPGSKPTWQTQLISLSVARRGGHAPACSSCTASARFEIVARQDFSDTTYLLEFRHPIMARAAKAGQFVIVMSHAEGERIPLTIADFDRARGTVTLVIQAVGKTTKEMQ